MSPRSAEFLEGARRRLVAARTDLDAGVTEAGVSAAYYAMLYAARAALSEEDRHARTHAGTWGLFHETFVSTGRFPAELASEGARAQEMRESGDYRAEWPVAADAETLVKTAERFVQTIAEMIEA